MTKPILGVKRLHEDALIPQYQTEGAAGFDIHANEKVVLEPDHHTLVSTGLSFEIPVGYVGLLFPRSGNAVKKRINLINCVGVIDSDYRGELKAPLNNDNKETVEFEKGDRIAQMIIMPFVQVEFQEKTDLTDTERGSGGFGSSGK